jgi:hypothetical protein
MGGAIHIVCGPTDSVLHPDRSLGAGRGYLLATPLTAALQNVRSGQGSKLPLLTHLILEAVDPEQRILEPMLDQYANDERTCQGIQRIQGISVAGACRSSTERRDELPASTSGALG